MTRVTLSGVLVCQDSTDSELVATLLPAHIALTRREPGCESFDVEITDDPLIWTVNESFSNQSTFRAHQNRVAGSQWGLATAHLERRYTVTGLDPA